MGEQAVTGAGATPAPEQTPDATGEDAAAATGSAPTGPTTAGMTADGAAGTTTGVPGAGHGRRRRGHVDRRAGAHGRHRARPGRGDDRRGRCGHRRADPAHRVRRRPGDADGAVQGRRRVVHGHRRHGRAGRPGRAGRGARRSPSRCCTAPRADPPTARTRPPDEGRVRDADQTYEPGSLGAETVCGSSPSPSGRVSCTLDLVRAQLPAGDPLGVVAGDPVPPISRSSGRSSAQRVGCAHGQRVWNRQPDGGLAGDGRSPVSRMRSRRVLHDRVRHRHRRHQRPGVRVQRLGVEPVARRLLDQRAQVHHADPVGDVPDHREVVRDDQVGQAEVVLQVLQQVDHLGLDRDVERGDRLVGDDQVGLERQRPGDADALPLAAGELVRVLATAPAVGRPTAVSRSRPMIRRRSSRVAADAVRLHPLGQDRLHVCRGSRRDSGSWKTICIRRRMRRAAAPACSVVSSTPSKMHRAGGRLGQPEHAPGREWSCRSRTRRPARRSRRAGRPGRRRRRRTRSRSSGRSAPPRLIGKCTFRSLTSSSTSAPGHGFSALSAAAGTGPRSPPPPGRPPARRPAAGGRCWLAARSGLPPVPALPS